MRRSRLITLALGALLATAVAASYLPAFRAGYIWDDDSYLTQNQTLDSPTALSDIWFSPFSNAQYYPLVFTSLYIQKIIWGLSPAPYHAVNIFLHALCALLLWRVLLRLRLPGAYAAALVFALHPINVESVAWVTERKNVLSGTFFMASALCLLHYLDLNADARPSARGGWYGGALLAFLCALLSKTVTVALPAVFVALLWAKSGRVRRAEIWGLLPFFVLGAGLSRVTVWVERMHVGAFGPDWDHTMTERALIAGRALWFYLGKIFWPENLAFIYERWQINAGQAAPYLYPAGMILLAGLLWLLRKRITRAPFAGLCIYFFTLFPSLGFVNVYPHLFSFVADHFAYLAMIAPVALATAGAAVLVKDRSPKIAAVFLCLLAAVLGTLTFRQARAFANPETLWTHTLEINPDAWMAHNNMGVFLAQHDRADEAQYHFLESLRLRPDLAEVHYNLAGVYAKKGDSPKALEELRLAQHIDSYRPLIHFQVGQALEQEGKTAEAEIHYRKALKNDPNHPAAHYALAALLDSRGDEKRALFHFIRALLEDPGLGEAHYGIGLILTRHQDWERAAHQFQMAMETRSENPEVSLNLGVCLAQLGRTTEADELFRRTLAMNPGNIQARENLAILLALRGDKEEAAEQFSVVVGQDPGNGEAWYNLGALLSESGRTVRARECFLTAVERTPGLAAAHYALGLAFEESGEKEKAGAELSRASELDPGNRLYREKLDDFRKRNEGNPR
ncbi:MAG: tetratricopeptide repeat protein [Thermodesulfobacteriota bacterium]